MPHLLGRLVGEHGGLGHGGQLTGGRVDEGDLAERRTKRGKSFWGCVRYPACDFSTWNKPVAEPCPACGWVGMEKKMNKAEGETRTCLKCGHKIVLAEPDGTFLPSARKTVPSRRTRPSARTAA